MRYGKTERLIRTLVGKQHTITLRNGSTIKFSGKEDRDKLRSLLLDGTARRETVMYREDPK